MRLVANRDIREPDLAHIEAPFFACSKVRQFLLSRSGPERICGIPNTQPYVAGLDYRQRQQKLLQAVEEGRWFLVIDSGRGPLRPPVRWQADESCKSSGQWIVDESLAPAPRFNLTHAVARIERDRHRTCLPKTFAPEKFQISPIDGHAWDGMRKRYANFFSGDNAYPEHLTAADEKGIGSKLRNLYDGNDTIQNQADIQAYNNTPSFLGVTHGQIFDAMENVVTLASLFEGGLALSRLKDAGKIVDRGFSGLHNQADTLSSFAIQKRGGAGGNWKLIDEVQDPSVIQQVNSLSCGQACVGMLLSDRKISVPQETIAKLIGDGPTYEAELASALNKLDSFHSRQWIGAGVDAEDLGTFHGLSSTGSWVAQLWEKGNRIGHWIVVDGMDDASRVIVRDPWNATKYKMDLIELQNSWTGYSVWGQ